MNQVLSPAQRDEFKRLRLKRRETLQREMQQSREYLTPPVRSERQSFAANRAAKR
ncbi:hypothetical protein [Hydrogenophaga crassostreae]|uniref:hypothetical protein n=1 Tax=Hydrogenophaga crassostreae TaxID=1763535 RepID=UPI000AC8617A|nr:hypothetical protein [Hydrogenophaga crassostreae]